jgi:hypothetical protein
MHYIEDILKTFDTAQIAATKSNLNIEMYAKLKANKTNNNIFHPAVLAVILLVVLNIAVYKSLNKNEVLENNKTYSKADIFREFSNELLINPSQHK